MSARLRIVAVNDVYSLECLPRLTSLVHHHKTVDPADAFLVVIAGDFVAPSVLSSLDAGRGMVDCLNHIPITHAILGNHEDDIGVDQLRARLHELVGTILMTNVHGLDDSFPKREVLPVAGVRVGLIGVTDGDPMLYRRTPFGGARIDSANGTARQVADELLGEGCSSVIAITHQRAVDDRVLARTAPPFAVIIGGHEHDGLLEHVGETWVTKAPADAVQATIIELSWSDGALSSVHARFDPVEGYPEEPAMRARVDKHMSRVRELETATMLLLPQGEKLSSVGARARQTSMGTMICSRLRDAFDAEGCLFNGGGIRGARDYEGRLTYHDVKMEVPFDNEIVVARLPGRVVREAVAFSRAAAPREFGGFLQVDDRMTVNQRHEVTLINGVPLHEERSYRIALVRNLFEGMDGVEPLVRFAREHPAEIPMATSGREVKIVLVAAFSAMLWEQLGGFDAIDRNHDGVVTPEELVDAIARAGGEPPSPMAARVVLDALDINQDGRLTPDEAPKKV
jgi:2',3'-cyclic-nucleotide 2'-phosphodiesterase (5'-nucleotidase family)